MSITRRVFLGGAVVSLASPVSAMVGPLLGIAKITSGREAMISVAGGRGYVRVNGDIRGAKPPIVFIDGGPGSSH